MIILLEASVALLVVNAALLAYACRLLHKLVPQIEYFRDRRSYKA